MKTFITSIFAVMLATFAMAPAFAAEGRNVYTGVYGGWNWDNAATSEITNSTGGVAGAVIGTSVPAVPNLRVELDTSYRTNDFDLFDGCLKGSEDTVALMGNAVYDFPVTFAGGQPYGLVGVGVAKTDMTFENVSVLQVASTGLAYQAGAGMNWNVADGIKAGAGYRYFAGPEVVAFGNQLSDGSNSSVVAQVTFSLN